METVHTDGVNDKYGLERTQTTDKWRTLQLMCGATAGQRFFPEDTRVWNSMDGDEHARAKRAVETVYAFGRNTSGEHDTGLMRLIRRTRKGRDKEENGNATTAAAASRQAGYGGGWGGGARP